MYNNTPQKIKAIIFDIDGTLYSNLMMFLATPFLYIRNFHWIFNFARMRKNLRKSIGVSTAAIDQNETLHIQNRDKIQRREFQKMSITLFQKETNMNEKESKYLLEKHIYDAWIKGVAKIPLRWGMRTLLGTLHRNNIKLGVLSDFQAQQKIENWNLRHYFRTVVCAEDYGTLKPDPSIFHKTCELLDCSPSEVLFVGNHLCYDGRGAANVGMDAVIFNYRSLKGQYHDNITRVRDMRALKKFLKKRIAF